MKLVVDTNVLFTFFWKNSSTKDIINLDILELSSPEYALEEIKKYTKEILLKAKITQEEFHKIRVKLATKINFIELEKYKDKLPDTIKISPDKNDVDFFALALKNNCAIWSNDKLLKNQESILVLSTKELISLLKS